MGSPPWYASVGGPGPSPTIAVHGRDTSAPSVCDTRCATQFSPCRRARPRSVIGAEVWVKGAPPGDPHPTLASPADPGEQKFILLSTGTPAVAEFTSPADDAKTAHYLLRWLSTRGEAGPWNETASATIGALKLSGLSRQLSA